MEYRSYSYITYITYDRSKWFTKLVLPIQYRTKGSQQVYRYSAELQVQHSSTLSTGALLVLQIHYRITTVLKI